MADDTLASVAKAESTARWDSFRRTDALQYALKLAEISASPPTVAGLLADAEAIAKYLSSDE